MDEAQHERPTFANDRRQKEMIKRMQEKLSELRDRLNPYMGSMDVLSEPKADSSAKSPEQLTSFEKEQHETINMLKNLEEGINTINRSLKL